MDPASAVGVASSAIAFLEFTYEFASAVYSILTDNASSEYESLEESCRLMREKALQLLSTRCPPGTSTVNHVAINSLARQCRALSDSILKRIEKTRPKSRKIPLVLKAALSAAFSKEELARLQRNLDICRGQLFLMLSMEQSERAQESLQKLEEASDSLRSSLESSREAANQQAIIDALSFDGMRSRYQEVSDAADNTFDWIFEDSGLQQMSSNLALISPFKDWLEAGEGIFHIAGKPGSGKSTLMKYLWKHHQTTSLLETWAGDKKLVQASFFLWRPGSPAQRSLMGLVRSLIHHILSCCPEVIPDVFPRLWYPGVYEPWGVSPKLTLEDDEVLGAFNNLIENGDVYEDHRFFFFIDGLDEFDEQRRTHTNLVLSLQDWVSRSQGHLKICVSSRELPVFQELLAAGQRIRLQELTRDDIENVVRQTLELERTTSRLALKEAEHRDSLVYAIIGKADGVFLWVVLVLKSICEAIRSDEPLSSLLAMIDTIPRELEDLFRHLLDSIPKAQQKKAAAAFEFTMTLQGRYDSLNQGGAQLFRSTSLLRYSLLDDFIDNPVAFEEKTMAKIPQYMTDDELEKRLRTSASRITGRFKGLLELRGPEMPLSSGTTLAVPKDDLWSLHAMFTHRSIPEFLAGYLQQYWGGILAEFDVLEALLMTLMGVLNTLPRQANTYHEESQIVAEYCFIADLFNDESWTDKHRCFPLIDRLDAIALQLGHQWRYGFHDRRLNEEFRLQTGRDVIQERLISVPLHLFAMVLCPEYMHWRFGNNDTQVHRCDDERIDIFFAMVAGAALTRNSDDRASKAQRILACFRFMLERDGACDEPGGTGMLCGHDMGLWSCLLSIAVCPDISKALFVWFAVEQFLECGAPLPLWVNDMHPEGHALVVQGKVCRRDKPHEFCDFPDLGEEGATATLYIYILRDLVVIHEPGNAARILELLDAREDPVWPVSGLKRKRADE